jgi:hypothetical protein
VDSISTRLQDCKCGGGDDSQRNGGKTTIQTLSV